MVVNEPVKLVRGVLVLAVGAAVDVAATLLVLGRGVRTMTVPMVPVTARVAVIGAGPSNGSKMVMYGPVKTDEVDVRVTLARPLDDVI
jgi:hypothetical protein